MAVTEDDFFIVDSSALLHADYATAARRLLQMGRTIIAIHEPHTPIPASDTATVTLSTARHRDPIPPWIVVIDDVEAELRQIATTVRTAPHAAHVLNRLLAIPDSVPAYDRLDMESVAYSMLLASAEFATWRSATPRSGRAACSAPVSATRSGSTLAIALDDPARHNAFSASMRHHLLDALAIAHQDPTVLKVLISGDGPTFCSGGDLDEFGTASDVATAHRVRMARSVAASMLRLSDRVHVRMHGRCYGAGIELPAFAKRVTAAPNTTITLPELRMGLIPGSGGTVSIRARIGPWRTSYLALSAHPLDIVTAVEWGLVDGLD